MTQTMSSMPAATLRAWRVFIECAFALLDILDDELKSEHGLTLRWYDALVHLEEADEGLAMNELAGKILASKSGLTKVVDRMSTDGLVRRERSEHDRRVVRVMITDKGRSTLTAARVVHRKSIAEHFGRHVGEAAAAELMRALEPVRTHARSMRPGRVRG